MHKASRKKKTIAEELLLQSSVFEKTIGRRNQIFAMMSGMLNSFQGPSPEFPQGITPYFPLCQTRQASHEQSGRAAY